MEIAIHNPKELAKLIKKAPKADMVAILRTIEVLNTRGIEALDTKTLTGFSPLKEIRILADNQYRMIYTQTGDTITIWNTFKKTSPQAQDRAIKLAKERHRANT